MTLKWRFCSVWSVYSLMFPWIEDLELIWTCQTYKWIEASACCRVSLGLDWRISCFLPSPQTLFSGDQLAFIIHIILFGRFRTFICSSISLGGKFSVFKILTVFTEQVPLVSDLLSEDDDAVYIIHGGDSCDIPPTLWYWKPLCLIFFVCSCITWPQCNFMKQ